MKSLLLKQHFNPLTAGVCCSFVLAELYPALCTDRAL